MSKRKTPEPKKRRPTRSGAPWPRRAPAAAELGPVERETLAVLLALLAEFGREPEPAEVARRLGLSLRETRLRLATVARLGVPARLTPRQEQCIRAIAALEVRLGRSPSTREVSAEMGLSPAGSRFHIATLVRLGLVTPPEMVLVLSVTPAGRVYVPAA